MAFFTSNPEYATQEARSEYAVAQLEDSRFVYEDPDDDERPGAFLSEFLLRIFAVHIGAIHGFQLIDTVDAGWPGYQTGLALAVAAVRFFILFQSLVCITDLLPG
jgi:hypothetical protein